jgi:hypothetical protein
MRSHFAGQNSFFTSVAIGLAVAISCFVRPALAVDNTWTFDGDGNWSDAGNWSLNIPADGGVDALIDDGDTAVTVTMDASRTVNSLTLGSNDTLLIQSGANSVTLTSSASFTNAGTINVTGTDIQTTWLYLPTSGNDTLTNSGTINFQVGAGTGSRTFLGDLVNSGSVSVNYDTTFIKSGGSYTNTGQLTVASGKTLTIANSGMLNQNTGGTFTLDGELENSTFNMNGGTMNFGASALVDNGNFNYLGGAIAGDVKLRNTTFTIGAGTNPETFQLDYNNTLASDVGAGHIINVQSGAAASVTLQSNASFTNAGTINVTGTDIHTTWLYLPTSGNDTLTNTGTINFGGTTGSRTFLGDLVSSGAVNVNYDTTFIKSGGSYANTGQLTVASGKTLTIANSGTLNQNTGGTFTLDGELENSTFNMNGGTMNFGASALVDNGNFNYLGGAIAGDVKLRNTTFTIGAGTNPETFQLDYNNTLASDVGAGHTINVQSGASASVTLTATSFTNAGTINVTGTDVQATWLYLPTSGNDTLTNTGTLNFGGGSGTRLFLGDLVNSGTVNVNYDTTFTKSGGSYTNNGRINVASGDVLTISNAGNLTNLAGTTLTGGTYDVTGVFQFPDALIHTNQAEIILRGANGAIRNSTDNSNALSTLATNGASGKLRLLEGYDFQTAATVFTNDGVLELGDGSFGYTFLLTPATFNNTATGQILGSGMFVASSGVNLNNAGLVSPGASPGAIAVNGAYTQTSTGTLAIGIEGDDNSNPMSPEYDALYADVLNLGGTLSLSLQNGFVPTTANVFTIMDAFTLSGMFSNVGNGQRLTTTGGEGSFVVNYNFGPATVTLTDFVFTADYNGNGIVDGADYVLWRKSPGSYGGPGGYAAWRSSFGLTNLPGAGSGAGSGGIGSAAVPEPNCIAIFLLGMAGLAIAGRRRTAIR